MKLIKGTDAITKAINSIETRGKKLDQDIQIAACSIIGHIDEHGDVTLANTLINAMPKGSRVNALLDFINTFGKVSYDEAEKAFTFNRDKKTDLVGAVGIMWTEFKPEAPYKPLDLQIMLQQLLKKANERSTVATDQDNIDPKLLAKLNALVTVE